MEENVSKISQQGKQEDGPPMFYVGDDVLIKSSFPQGDKQLFEELPEGKRIILGVCAMEKKSNSKPMGEIIDRLEKFMQIQTLIFEEDVILNKPIEEWPVVDVLISFFSAGFPLDKAIEYTKLREPFVINDLESQYAILDRREVYKKLFEEEILHPRYAVLNREENGTTSSPVTILDDTIDIGGSVFHKPFVEKPVSAEDHNIIIYFPQSAGGGSQRLFRKVGSRSSVYSQVSRVRKTGSYIYEDFMPTDGTDVKVYTVGPDYAHAEARKSPALDGKVERDEHGKEIRYPVLLSAREKLLARKVSLAFKQTVCGFDLLRANGKSYVCDVNGFSFVKNSTKYYDDCAKILGTMIMRACAPQLHIPWVLGSAPEDIPVVPTTSGSMMELRCVLAVIRHGDRTPKQKMKMEVKHKKFFELFEKYDGYKNSHLKLKKPKQLQEVLDIARFLLSENQMSVDPEVKEKKAKLQQLKLVLEMYGHFSGINRKVQLKYQPNGHSKRSSSEEDDTPRPPSLLLIVKWGGELTPAGKIQAEGLGKAFRTLYPGGQGQFETPGLGFLRLHSTFRHDLKIYASDEGRVQMTAAAFTKGLLALEGELTPILVQMVKSANTNGLLDKQGEASKYQHVVKERLTQMLNEDADFSEKDYLKLAPTNSDSLLKAMKFIKNPRKLCEHVHNMVKELTAKVRTLKLEHRTRDLKLYHGESWELLIRRWAKLEKDFKMKDGRFDVSKIPDIYDCSKYDLQHNQKTIQYEHAEELFQCSKALADIVIPQEYGITVDEKLHISQSVCTPIMRKIRSDMEQCVCPTDEDDSTRLNSLYSLGVSSPQRFVRTRLYFTSESHIHSLLNMLRYGGFVDENYDHQWEKAMDYINTTSELNYMTQIIIMMFEDPSKDILSDDRFHIELHFSPGAYSYGEKGFHFPLCSSRSFSAKGPRTKSDDSEEKNQSEKLQAQYEWSKHCKEVLDRPVSAPMIIQEQEEFEESEMFEHNSAEPNSKFSTQPVLDVTEPLPVPKCKKTPAPEPKSPDPNIPEWDWGSDHEEKSKDSEDNELSKVSSVKVSDPIEIQSTLSSSHPELNAFEPVRSQSLEEKRSRSLEDKQPEQKTDKTALYERHYLTVHLPLPTNTRRQSCSSLFYLNPEAFKAFEGFNMVPSLHPLETLHNKLTLRELDEFLKRATTSKFVTPISSPPSVYTPLASPRVPLIRASKVGNQSSSNSSTGPSSPTNIAVETLVLSKLQEVVINRKQDDVTQPVEVQTQSLQRKDNIVPNTQSDPGNSKPHKQDC